MELHRLIYSSLRKAQCDDQEIAKILATAQKNNAHEDITGILLHSADRFLQYIEGDAVKIQALFDKIKQDPRHGGAIVRDFSPISERLFPSWQMGHVDMNQEIAFESEITAKDQAVFSEWFEDTDVTDSKLAIIKRFASSQKSKMA